MNQERATEAQRLAALAIHAVGDELEIDDAALISQGDDGYWVQAWVWVPVPKKDNDD